MTVRRFGRVAAQGAMLAVVGSLVGGPLALGQTSVSVSPELDAEVQSVIAQVEAVRGMARTQDITWRLADADEALTEQLARITEDPEVVERLGQDERILTRLGMLPPDTDLLTMLIETLRGQIAGYYDTDTQDLTVIDADGVLDTTSRITLAHEAQHALQDQRWDLDALTDAIDPVEGDQLLAVQALIEGDATLLMTMWALQHASSDLMGDMTGPGMLGDDQLADLPPVVQRQLLFPYLDGMSFLMNAWGPGGWDAVDRIWDAPPVSTEQIMHPEKYPDELPVPVRLPDLAEAMGDGWTTTGESVMGELNTAIWVADGGDWDPMAFSLGGQEMPNASAAAGWGGDRVVTLDGTDGAWALAWQTAWDTPDDASESVSTAVSTMQDLPGAWEVLEADLTGDGLPSPVLVLIADDQETLEALIDASGRLAAEG